MGSNDWQPTTDRKMLEARAELLQQVRLFFAARGVLEVETPLLASAIGTDPLLDPVRAGLDIPGRPAAEFFLQTSPEFAMKRLLAAGSGAIYQLGKAFRNGETGSRHNPEFTLLEWYRPGFTLAALMDEVDALAGAVLGTAPARRITYSDLFMEHLAIEPLAAECDALRDLARDRLDTTFASDNPDYWLDLLFSHCIEPQLQAPVFITHYPPSQAALAQLAADDRGRTVALRFELVARGMELANGYQELTDAGEQRRRFAADQARRRAEGLPVHPVDERFLAALEHGLPACAGVALGFDRLLMLKTGSKHISEVISFPVARA